MHIFIRFLIYTNLLVGGMYAITKFLINHYHLNLLIHLEKLFIFHLVVSIFVLLIIYTIFSLLKKYTAYAFIGTSFIRMAAITIFVLPLMKKAIETPILETFIIMIPYFVLTAVEAFFTIKLVNTSK